MKPVAATSPTSAPVYFNELYVGDMKPLPLLQTEGQTFSFLARVLLTLVKVVAIALDKVGYCRFLGAGLDEIGSDGFG